MAISELALVADSAAAVLGIMAVCFALYCGQGLGVDVDSVD